MRVHWLLLAIFSVSDAFVRERGRKLLFAQVVFRHGDRTPLSTFPSDPVKEHDWQIGGGGFGQLTPKGLMQEAKLGRMLNRRYVGGLVNDKYDASQMYLRATDRNRTLNSATAMAVGLTRGMGREGVDTPEENEYWPAGYFPLPVHTQEFKVDHEANPSSHCPRRTQLWSIAKQTAEFQRWLLEPEVRRVLEVLNGNCGRRVDIDDAADLFITLTIERAYMRPKMAQWYTDGLDKKLKKVSDAWHDFYEGVSISSYPFKGLNLQEELAKVRGGPLLKNNLDRISQKIACLEDKSESCRYMNRLRLHMISAHDSTVAAYLAALGIKKEVIPSGYPAFAAAVYTELWLNNAGDMEVQVLYSDQYSTAPRPVSQYIEGCPTSFCPIDRFRDRAAKVDPGDIKKLCSRHPLVSQDAPTSLISGWIESIKSLFPSDSDTMPDSEEEDDDKKETRSRRSL